MADARQIYWEEAVEISLDEEWITATKEQIKRIACGMQSAAENQSQAFGWDCIPNPVELELKETKRKLSIEQEKIICPRCKGKGRLIDDGPVQSSNSECWNCHGEGRLLRQNSRVG